MRAPAPRSLHRLAHLVLVMVAICVLLALAPATSHARAPRTVAQAEGSTAYRGTRDFATLPRHCRDTRAVVEICRVTRFDRRPWLVVWGDSHALQYLPPIWGLAIKHRVNLVQIYSGGCPISKGFPVGGETRRLTCDNHNDGAFEYVRDLVASGRNVKLLLGTYWEAYRNRYAAYLRERKTGEPSGLNDYEVHIARLGVERSAPMFRAIGRTGVSVDLLAQAGTVPDDAPACPAGELPYQCELSRRAALPTEAGNRRWQRRLAEPLHGSPRVIDPAPVYCDSLTCYPRVGAVNTFFDQGHLTASITRTMRSYFAPTFRDLIGPRRAR